jgi:drug/metabolite transporter (DMT)-like permease
VLRAVIALLLFASPFLAFALVAWIQQRRRRWPWQALTATGLVLAGGSFVVLALTEEENNGMEGRAYIKDGELIRPED